MIQAIRTRFAPMPGKNYNQGVKIDVGTGWLVYVSGQTGNVLEGDQKIVDDESVFRQTYQALNNIEGVIGEVGGSRKDIVDITAFLTSIEKKEKTEFEEAYSSFFSGFILPARALVQVSRLPLITEKSLVELKAVAFIPKGYK